MKKLKNPQDSTKKFFRRISVLEDKLGPVLFQLPPRWHFNPERFCALLDALSKDYQYAFEFRDHSWLNDRTYSLLSEYDAAFCIYELNGFQSPKEVTTDFVYIRLHGPNGPYQGSYNKSTLSGWAGAISTWMRQDLTIYCYFDNDDSGYAPHNALTLQNMLKTKT